MVETPPRCPACGAWLRPVENVSPERREYFPAGRSGWPETGRVSPDSDQT